MANFNDKNNYKLRLKEIESLILKAKDVFRDLEVSEKKIGKKYNFSANSLLRGNFFGNLIRSNKVNLVNSNIDRCQQALLDFHSDLLLFDEFLADKLILPSKMSEFSQANGKFSDIAIRTNMRLKEFDLRKAKRSLETIIRRLEGERKKVLYEISKLDELNSYEKNKEKGKISK